MYTIRRKDSLRYSFAKPLTCLFRIIKMNGKSTHTNNAAAHLLDLSRDGCKLQSHLDLKTDIYHIKILVSIQLGNEMIQLIGVVKWHLHNEGTYSYGIQFLAKNSYKKIFISELKHMQVQANL